MFDWTTYSKLTCLQINVDTILFSDRQFDSFLSYFFVKKYLLVGASSMLRTGQWIIQWVRDVCMSHQSDRIYYKQPIKFLVLKVNGLGRFDPDTVQNGHIYSTMKE